MADKIPFDDDVMTLIMGLGGPEEPGQHGRKHVPMPGADAIDLVTQIRDLCEDFLKKADKGPEEKPEKMEKPAKEEAPKEEPMEEEPPKEEK